MDGVELTGRAKQLSAQYKAADGRAAIDVVNADIQALRNRVEHARAKQPGSIHPHGRMPNGKYKNTCGAKDPAVTARKEAARAAHNERMREQQRNKR